MKAVTYYSLHFPFPLPLFSTASNFPSENFYPLLGRQIIAFKSGNENRMKILLPTEWRKNVLESNRCEEKQMKRYSNRNKIILSIESGNP